jgi:hypothetical protein
MTKLAELVDDIQIAIEDEDDAFSEVASSAAQAGMLLLMAKKRVPKDKWGAWLKKNFNLTPKAARERYVTWFTDMPPEEQSEWNKGHEETRAS